MQKASFCVALRTIVYGVLAVFLAATVPATTASSSTLVDQGDNTTLDSATGLLWLDVNLTIGLSYNTVTSTLLGSGQTYDGWRYATGLEISEMWINADITNPYGSPNGAANSEFNNYHALMDLIGDTYSTALARYILAWTGDINGSGNVGLARLYLCLTAAVCGGPSQGATTNYFSYDPNTADSNSASFLVKEQASLPAVPLPAALPLFATGLGAVGLLGWRRKRKAAAITA